MTSPSDPFSALLAQITAALQAEQRISYRGLKRRFNLSDDDLADIKDELIHARQIAADENDTVLVWREAGAAAAEAAPPPVPVVATRPGYTPRHLAEKILKMRSAIEGEKKQVTVLFCDTVNSTMMGERIGAEGWHETMNRFFAGLTDAVHRLGGSVNQYTGDGAIVLFGAPLSLEDHAHRACMAALRIRDAVATLDARLRAEYGIGFAIRIGLNSGEVVVGTIGDDLRMDYTAQGFVMAVAARLENLAAPNTILMSDACRRAVAGLCEVKSLGLHSLKGVSTPMEVFELQSVASSANRFDTSRARGLTRFVGREADLVQLEDALQTARAGTGQVVGVVADAGTGKSRLFHEFLETCRARGMTVLTGHAVSHGAHVPYLPMLQVFRSYYGIEEREDPASAREKIAHSLARLDGDFSETLPLVFELLGVADRSVPMPQIDPDAKQRQLFELLRRTIQGADPMAGSVVTCIEDLHWMDPASERFLEQWVEAQANSNRLLLLNFRPGYQADWMSKSYYRQIVLAPLTPQAVRALLVDLLGEDPSTEGLADAIFERTGGNPFYCEEIVRSLRESGDLSLHTQRFRLDRPLHALTIPASVQSILATRIDRLDDPEKSLLQVASVIGREFSPELIQQVAGLLPEVMHDRVEMLKEAEFVLETASGNGSRYSFKHALTQEVALNSLLRDKRRLIHARVAECMEELAPDQLDEQASLRAWHWEEASQPAKAAQSYVQAAVHIRSGNRTQQMDYLRRALQLTADLPASAERLQIRLQSLIELITGGAWRFTMSDAELDEICKEAQQLAEQAGLREVSFMIRAGRCAASGMMAGDIRSWSTVISALVADARDVSAEVTGSLTGQCSYAMYASGQFERGLAQIRQAEELAAGNPHFGQTFGFSVTLAVANCAGLTLAAMGRLDEAFSTYRSAIALALSSGATEELIWVLSNQAEAVYPKGLPPDHPWVREAISNAVKGHAQAEQVASDFTRGVGKRCLTIALLMQRRFAEAESAALDCLAHLRKRRAHLEVEASCLGFLAEAQLGMGRPAAALITAREAVARGQAQGALYFECKALLSLASALMVAPDAAALDEAAATLDTALASASAIGTRALLARIIEQQGRLLALRGNHNSARVRLAEALDGYRSVNAEGHALRLAEELA